MARLRINFLNPFSNRMGSLQVDNVFIFPASKGRFLQLLNTLKEIFLRGPVFQHIDGRRGEKKGVVGDLG